MKMAGGGELDGRQRHIGHTKGCIHAGIYMCFIDPRLTNPLLKLTMYLA